MLRSTMLSCSQLASGKAYNTQTATDITSLWLHTLTATVAPYLDALGAQLAGRHIQGRAAAAIARCDVSTGFQQPTQHTCVLPHGCKVQGLVPARTCCVGVVAAVIFAAAVACVREGWRGMVTIHTAIKLF